MLGSQDTDSLVELSSLLTFSSARFVSLRVCGHIRGAFVVVAGGAVAKIWVAKHPSPVADTVVLLAVVSSAETPLSRVVLL